jgi:SAM-dependent methyltransferase
MSESTNFAAARGFVEFGLEQRRKGRRESASGPGSALAAAAQTLALLDEITQELPIRKMVDLGCGDWNWMKEAHWYRSRSCVDYVGWEASPELVGELQRLYGRPGVSFALADIVEHAFPPADLLICRDVLFHLPIALALRAAKKIMRSRGLLLATTYPDQTVNTDIMPQLHVPVTNWGFYRINLDIPPFHFAPWMRRQVIEPLCAWQNTRRAICLYDFRDVELGYPP